MEGHPGPGECLLPVCLLRIVFIMINAVTVLMCFNGDICLLAVCVCHESEEEKYRNTGRVSLQVCLEANQTAHFFLDAFCFAF